ncbi:hypothetical protein [Coleofasciculus chthonoplastes]|nr:hypothetical protein [Coleofasciculus chthonoplastes]
MDYLGQNPAFPEVEDLRIVVQAVKRLPESLSRCRIGQVNSAAT